MTVAPAEKPHGDERTPLDHVRSAIHALVIAKGEMPDEAYDSIIKPLRKAFDDLEFLYD